MATRRRFTPEFKARVVLELISGAKSLAEVCRHYQLNPQMVARWKSEFLGKRPKCSRPVSKTPRNEPGLLNWNG